MLVRIGLSAIIGVQTSMTPLKLVAETPLQRLAVSGWGLTQTLAELTLTMHID